MQCDTKSSVRAQRRMKTEREETLMKTLKSLIILSFIVFITCSPALALIDVQQYLNPDATVNQAAIEAAIAGGSDPVTLASDLAGARCDLASEFAEAVATASPNLDIEVLKQSVIAAATQACPNKVDQVTEAMQTAFPTPAGNSFQATNALTDTTTNLQIQDTLAKEYQVQKGNPSPFK